MENKTTKVLVIGMSLNVGGTEKSLINFLNMIDSEEYSVDLLLFQKEGAFLKQIPEWINVIEVKELTILYQSINKTLKMEGNKLKNLYLGIYRYVSSIMEKIKWKQFDRIRINRWNDYYKSVIPNNPKSYDVGVAFSGGETAYYLVDKVDCKRKVYYFHSDYSRIDIDANLEKKFVNAVDQVVTISEACKKSLEDLFPTQKNKIIVLQNLSSPELIDKLSNQYYPSEYKDIDNDNDLIILSVGRLHEVKGYDMAIDAANKLNEKDIKFSWFIIGEGEERKKLEKQIDKYGLQSKVILLGLRENPYPYIRNADIIVQSSRFEGKSIVLDEAKILNKIIVSTDYNSVYDQIIDGYNGIIVPMSPEGIFDGIENLICNKEFATKIKSNLSDNDNNSVSDIQNYINTVCGSY